MNKKIIYGETPHNGVKTIFFFFDEKDNPCEEYKAKKVQIIEYDKNDNIVFSIITAS